MLNNTFSCFSEVEYFGPISMKVGKTRFGMNRHRKTFITCKSSFQNSNLSGLLEKIPIFKRMQAGNQNPRKIREKGNLFLYFFFTQIQLTRKQFSNALAHVVTFHSAWKKRKLHCTILSQPQCVVLVAAVKPHSRCSLYNHLLPIARLQLSTSVQGGE